MNTRWFVSVVLVAALIGFLGGRAFTEDAQPSEEEMMKMMKELGTPGAAHKGLEPMIGDWDVESKMWMKPGEPQVSKASSSNSWFLGGRFVKTHYKGSFMGESFEGHALLGYDNFKKEYQSIWVDSWSTCISTQTGSRDGNAVTMTGVWEGPMGKIPSRMVHTFVDENTMVLTAYMTMEGQEMKHMELTYTRKKPTGNGACCPPSTPGPGY